MRQPRRIHAQRFCPALPGATPGSLNTRLAQRPGGTYRSPNLGRNG
ncbi:hypothetical protein NSU_3446 [Novosphingobium pentaromativorans US6-1]|uniref:Uncharacterized protein n=1 Tax=Novosphingobium pentaromativorans US6-1 TaxID=1088721 RepID=G6EGL5_9SPHN|nr:hypothetical protein NSU_3446 [Novosphingobium pentaromativorans US6-1]